MLMILGIIFWILIIILIVFLVHSNKKKKDENTARITVAISSLLAKYEANGVNSLEKTSLETEWLAKNEYAYGRYEGSIVIRKYLKSGIKLSPAGYGHIVISDKAITIESNSLKSGKRRFLFKNMDGGFYIDRTARETKVFVTYAKYEIIFNLNENTLKYFALAIHLMRNPINDTNSITF